MSLSGIPFEHTKPLSPAFMLARLLNIYKLPGVTKLDKGNMYMVTLDHALSCLIMVR
jgi:hypothetical protein